MRLRHLPVLTAALALVVLAACGQEFNLPPQPDPQDVTLNNTYNLSKVWSIPSPTAMASQGSWVYVIEEEQRVHAYFTGQQRAIRPTFISEFQGLVRPVDIAVAERESIYVYVADAGDMTVKRYHFTGGAPRFTFTDPDWTEFSGLAADVFLNVYVSDAARNSVYKYSPTGERDRLLSDLGSGRGFVDHPHGLYWNGRYVLVADTGKDWAQRLVDSQTNTAAPGPAIGEDFELNAPEGISTDRGDQNNIYVADTGSGRVFKFTVDGTFVDSVYTATKIPLEVPVDAPRHLAVAGIFVFLSDQANDRILGLELAGVPDTTAAGQP